MKKNVKINILSIITAIAIVSAFIVPFARVPIRASAGRFSGEVDGNQEILLGLSDLANESTIGNRENLEETIGASDISVKPPTTSPEIKENLESFEETEVAPLGLSLFMAPYATIGYATDFATLKSLIETNNGIDYIKMDGDIEITGVINVPAIKPNLTIDGLYEGGRRNFVLTENKLSVGAYNVNIYAPNTTYIELKNMGIDGYNYYGPVYGGDRANFTIKYDNVIYDGPQITCVGQGSVHYKDFTATIRGYAGMAGGVLAVKPGAAAAQELAEAAHATFEGNIDVQTASSGNSIWYAYGTASNLIFMPGTKATFTSYSQVGAAGGYFLYGYPVSQIVIGEGADVTFNTPTGFAYNTSPAVNTVFLEENASLKIVSNSTLALIGRGLRTQNFDAAPNSNFFLSTYNAPLIITGGMLNINNPASFVTHSTGANSPIYMTVNSKVQVNAGAVNVWEGATTLSDDINNIPTNMWNKNSDASNVTMSWTQGVSAATNLTNNLVPADDFSTNTPSVANINLSNKRMVVIGQYDLSVTGHNSQHNTVSGQALANAPLRVSYLSNNIVKTEFFSADAIGEFAFKLSNSVDIGTKPEVMLQQNYLKATHYAENLAVLSLEHVPAIIDFGQITIPSSPTTMRWTDTTTDPWISVLDTRSTGSIWKLTVSAQPLTGTWNSTTHTLPNALLFVKDGQEIVLSDAQQVIYQGVSGTATQTFAWNNQNGIFVKIDPGRAKATSYTSTLNWILEDTP